MVNKKLKLLYLADFLLRQTDEEHPKTVQDMLDELERYGITAERKSVYADIHLLQDYGMDIQTVKGKNFGYFVGARDFQLPELKLLIDVVQASPFLTKSKSMELIAKLEGLTSKPTARKLRRQVYVMNRVRTVNEKLYYSVDGINTAINENKQVSFLYFDWTVGGGKAMRREGQRYVTDPVALCVDRHYYLVAYDRENGEYRHYRVDRMEGLTVEKTARGPLPEGFDLGSYVKTIFDMYNGETATVSLRMEKKLLNAAIDRFGADAAMYADSDDTFRISALVEVGPTFYGWLFQFGPQAELLSPPQVRADFADYCKKVLEKYD